MDDQWTSNAFVELTFELADDTYPIVRIAQRCSCRVELVEIVTTEAADESIVAFVRVTGDVSKEAIEDAIASAPRGETRLIEPFDDEYVAGLTLKHCLIDTLAKQKVLLESLIASDGIARIVTTVFPDQDLSSVVSAVREIHPSARFVGKRRCDLPGTLVSPSGFRSIVRDVLTDRQWEALERAYEGEYFERPRGRTQSELADEMDVSPSTFGQHLTTAVRKVFDELFEHRRTSQRGIEDERE